jgi:DNA helicase-2/ATP-dependent DNA helicase PcrA
MDAIRLHARDFGCSLWQASRELVAGGAMPKRSAGALQVFLDLIEGAAASVANQGLGATVDVAVDAAGLIDYFRKSRDSKAQDRVENLEELANAARRFTVADSETELAELDAFLAHAALEAGEAQADEYEDSVQLMTLHSAKGLEFPVVFLSGLEEGLFPHAMSADDPDRLEEERRLCYVGMTRAMQELYLTHAESRRLHGSERYPLPSRFLREIPAGLVEEIRLRPQLSRPYSQPGGAAPPVTAEAGLRLGQRVMHPRFGEGVVLNAEGQGAAARIQVKFEDSGTKWLVIAYANLSPL